MNALSDGGTLTFSCLASIHSPGVTLANRTGVTVTATSGAGMKALDNNGGRSWSLFQITNCTNCNIQNMLIDSRWMPAIGIHVNASNKTTIQYNTVQNVAQPAGCALCTINGAGNRENRYIHNRVLHTATGTGSEGTRGMWIGQNGSLLEYSPQIEYNYITDTGHTAMVTTADAAIVRYNTIEDLNAGLGCGIKFGGDVNIRNASYLEYNTIRGTTVPSRSCGIQVEMGSDRFTAPLYIQHNLLKNIDGSALYFGEARYSQDNLFVVDNDLVDTGQGHPFTVTIYGKYGVSGGSKLMFQNNRIWHDTATSLSSGAIMVDGKDGSIGTSGIVITGNTFSHGVMDGVHVVSGSQPINDVTMSNNHFVRNGRRGIYIDSGTNVKGITVTADNCYAFNWAGALYDGRGLIASPSQSAACGGTGSFTPVRMNLGGPAYTDTTGNVWSADYGSQGVALSTVQTMSNISADQTLYQTGRSGAADTLDYIFTVPDGQYNLTLKFAEISATAAGQRVFDAWINNQQVLTDFDIFREAGGANRPVDRTFSVPVINGQIAIHMVSLAGTPAINAIQILQSVGAPTAVRLRAGNSAYTDSTGTVWMPDTGYNQGGSLYSTTAAIANTTVPALYQTERFNPGVLTYEIVVPNGSYTVNLKFAEIYFTLAGKRVFNATINGQQVLTRFDPFVAAGGPKRAVDRSFPVTVTDGRIRIQFTGVVEKPKVNAIEITN